MPATGWRPNCSTTLEATGRATGRVLGKQRRTRTAGAAAGTRRRDAGGLRFTVVHETGAAAGREARMSRLYPDSDVLVFGHSHIPWDTTTKTGLRLLNPGSPTDRRRQPFCTLHDRERRATGN